MILYLFWLNVVLYLILATAAAADSCSLVSCGFLGTVRRSNDSFDWKCSFENSKTSSV